MRKIPRRMEVTGGPGKVDLTFNDISAAKSEFSQYLSVFTRRVSGLQCIGDVGG